MNDPAIIAWLESPAGERWSSNRARHNSDQQILLSIKDDIALDDESFLVGKCVTDVTAVWWRTMPVEYWEKRSA